MEKRGRVKLNYGRIFIAVFLLLSIIAVLVFFFVVRGSGSEHSIELKYGELDISGEFTALAIRNERVINASSSGKTSYKMNDGDPVEKGDVVLEIEIDEGVGAAVLRENEVANLAITKRMIREELKELRQAILIDMQYDRMEQAAARKREYRAKNELLGRMGELSSAEEFAKETYISTNQVSVYSGLRGMLSFSVDGLETAAGLANIYSFDFSKLDSIPQRTNVAKDRVRRGEQIYKVIDDSSIFIAIQIPLEGKPDTYLAAESYIVSIGNTELTGTLHDSFTQGDSKICIIRLSDGFPTFFTTRTMPCSVSVKGYKGLLIPSTALTEKEGVRGVLRVGVDGLAEFVPVKVLKNEAGSAIIQNGRFYNSRGELVQTVEIGQRVVKLAANFKEGDPIE